MIMGKLFLFEARKLVRQKSLYICFAVAVVLLVLNAASLAFLDKIMESQGGEFTDGMESGFFFGVASFTKSTFSNCSFFLLLSVIITLYCCDDYANCTIKNIYAKGYSRAKVYFTKYLFSLIVSMVLAAVSIVISYAIGAGFGKPDNCENLAAVMVCQLVTVIGYHGIFYSVSMMIGKVGGSLAINILAPMFFGIILTLLTSLVQNASENVNIDFGYIWFDSVYTELSKIPVKGSAFVRAILMSLIYAGGFVTLGFFVNRRKEV